MKTKQELPWCFLVLLDIKPRITLFKDTHIVRMGTHGQTTARGHVHPVMLFNLACRT